MSTRSPVILNTRWYSVVFMVLVIVINLSFTHFENLYHNCQDHQSFWFWNLVIILVISNGEILFFVIVIGIEVFVFRNCHCHCHHPKLLRYFSIVIVINHNIGVWLVIIIFIEWKAYWISSSTSSSFILKLFLGLISDEYMETRSHLVLFWDSNDNLTLIFWFQLLFGLRLIYKAIKSTLIQRKMEKNHWRWTRDHWW